MANVNTAFGFSLGLPVPISITGATETQIVVPVFTYNSGSPVPSPAFAAGAPLQVQYPADIAVGASGVDGHPFNVKIVGTLTAGTAATNFRPFLYIGNSTTLISGNQLAAPLAGASNAVTATLSYNFQLTANLLWDSTSKALNGTYSYQVGNNAPAAVVALTNAGASIAESGLIFTLSVTMTAQTGTTTLNLKEFAISNA